jgi:hypothetical protein
MAVDTGLMALGGIGQGLAAGVDTFSRFRKDARDEEKQKRDTLRQSAMTALLAQKQGYAYDPETGAISMTPVGQAFQDRDLSAAKLAGAQANDSLQDFDPHSEKAARVIGMTKGLLGPNAGLIPEGATPSEISGFGHVGDVMKEESAKGIAKEHNATAIKVAGIKAGAAGAKGTRLTDKQLKEINDFDEALATAKSAMEAKDDWVGPIRGRLPDMAVTPEEVAARANLGRQSDAYRKLITGAAASSQELKMLQSRLPGVTDMPGNFRSKGKAYIDQLERNRNIYISNLRRKGIDTSEYEPDESAASKGLLDGQAPAAPQVTEGRTATGPNGSRIVFRGGQWVPLK